MATTDPPDATDASESVRSGMAHSSETTDAPIDRDAVCERLDRVHDPELDRSIVDLQYVEEIEINGGAVTIVFVLPTAWCSPAFAWMMATGIRDEVGALPDVDSVQVRLSDHMHGEEITRGVNQELSFESVFEDAEDGIESVRRKLDEKTRFARQYRAIEALRGSGLDSDQIATLSRAAVNLEFGPEQVSVTVRDGALTVTVDREPLAEYLMKAQATGLVEAGNDHLFADQDGEPLDPEPKAFESSLRNARLAASNIEGQATICESLHESRNDVDWD